MLLGELVQTSAAVAAVPGRRDKVAELARLLTAAGPGEIEIAVAYLSGILPQGAIGLGWASLRGLPPPAPEPGTLTLADVDGALTAVAAVTGRGSRAARAALVSGLFSRTTTAERDWLVGLLLGETRQGALEGVVVDAIAAAFGLEPRAVRRAVMLSGSPAAVAVAAAAGGTGALAGFRLEVMHPVKPMLAHSADGVAAALRRWSPAAVEAKLDGARVQVHRVGARVRVFTRSLADVTERVPELTEAIIGLDCRSLILDGEAVALDPTGRPHPFQVTMARFGSRPSVEDGRARVPLTLVAFDCLHLDGRDLIDAPASERFRALERVVPEGLVVPRIVTAEPEPAERFFENAVERGYEGVVVKSLDAPYEAGRRGSAWLKVKRARTLDLVVLAAEWGHGRRRGWLSNLHLGARGERAGEFVMLGKTFKGLTDEMLAWQTRRLLELETHRDGITVFVAPELVVEVEFDGVQASSRYPGGVALRFARVKRYRPDKNPGDADAIAAVAALGPEAEVNRPA